jgi:hypothetical protein
VVSILPLQTQAHKYWRLRTVTVAVFEEKPEKTEQEIIIKKNKKQTYIPWNIN